ncbi:LPXTG cell wall anchor domain-containing protein [Streptomyces sp. NPDC014870]|uniref:LPXTG cell wall anchor domain-containing protein n=1 Tax=Streptomyces sp. NPDC014870 TaxID=3364925 RepID=UPI0036F66679
MLATAVAAAVTTPVVFLSAAPAFADTKPSAPAQTQNDKQDQAPDIDQLKKDVAAAQKVYDAAVVAHNDAKKAFKEFDESTTHPLKVARDDAKKAADAAATAKTEADAKLATAQAELDAANAGTDEAAKTAAKEKFDAAKLVADTAATTKTAADATLTAAVTAVGDKSVALSAAEQAASDAKDEALKKLDAAKEALRKAQEEEGEEEPPHEDCFPDEKFTSVLQGLPSKVVAGTTVDFKLRLTNGTDRTMDEAYAFIALHAFDEKGLKPLDKYLDLEWYEVVKGKGTWNDVPTAEELPVGTLKPKAFADIKLRLKVDADTPAGQGLTFTAGDFWNEDGTCGGTPIDMTEYEFDILAKGTDPGKVEDATGTPGGKNTTTQGGTSTTAVTTGQLAKTGSNDAMPQIALAGATAVALGAGAMFMVRRRKAGADA